MRLFMFPTSFLQMITFAAPAVKMEVFRRLQARTRIRDHLHEVDAGDVVASLDRCERTQSWMMFACAFVGMVLGLPFQNLTAAVVACLLGLVVGAVLSGIMVDNAYSLSELVGRLDKSSS